MKLKSKLELIKKQDKNKSTIIILVLLSLVVFTSFSFSKTVDYYLNDCDYEFDYYYRFGGVLDSSNGYPDLRESMDKLKGVKYVKDVFSTEESEYIVDVNKIGDKDIKGYVRLIGKTEDDLKELSNGKYKDKYSIICHKNYYPDIDHEVNFWAPRSKFISMNKYNGSNMEVWYTQISSRKRLTETLNIVEVVDNHKARIDENVCYASRELMWEIYQTQFKNVNQDVLWEDFLVDYDLDHYEEVDDEFRKLGFGLSSASRYIVDYTFSNFVSRLKIILLIVSIVAIGIFIMVFNKNKIKDKVKGYSILKTIGISDKEYNDLLDIESVWIVIKSFIISIFASLGVCIIVGIIRYIFPFFLLKIYLKFDWISLIIYYLFVLILLLITNAVYFKKIRKKSINENLGE